MRRSLPLSSSDAEAQVAVRTFVKGQDEEAWLTVNNRAFEHHPEQGGWDHATLSARLAQPWFDANGFVLHEIDNQLAGFCWTKVHHDTDPVLGEIYVIAVDPKFHGHGLGKSMVVSGLVNMSQRSIKTAMLYVDPDNSAAMALYEGLGFRVHRTDRAFVGDIAPITSTPESEQS
jgi:mycothiol synthase